MDWLVWHDKPITLHSGAESHWEVKGELMFADPHIKFSVIAAWCKALDIARVPRPYHFVGIPNGGIAWRDAMTEMYLEKDIASLEDAKTAIIVDDVATTGASIEAMIEELRAKTGSLGFPVLVVVRRGQVPVTSSWADMGGLGGQ